MPSWDIEPAGVNGVLGRTSDAASSFTGQLASIRTAMQGGAANSSSEIVAGAISGFAEHVRADIEFVTHRTGAVMAAAANATNAYLRGDLEMAANAQRGATAAPPELDLPGRGGHQPR